MKILPDEQLPVKLKYRLLPDIEASTVKDESWLGIKNGKLIELALSKDFIVFITNDKSLYYQQKIMGLLILFINLNQPSNRYEDILPVILDVKEWLLENEASLSSQIEEKNYFIYPDDFA